MPLTPPKRLCHTLNSTSHHCHLCSHGDSSQYLQNPAVMRWTKFKNKHFQKTNNPTNNKGRVMNFTQSSSLLSISLRSFKSISWTIMELWSGQYFYYLIKCQNSRNRQGSVINLALYTFLFCPLFTYEISRNILKGHEVILPKIILKWQTVCKQTWEINEHCALHFSLLPFMYL